jgi:hypothetical protein
VKNHVLLSWASRLAEADERARLHLTPEKIAEILEEVPDKWLLREGDGLSSTEKRVVYLDFFSRRLKASAKFVEEAGRARSELI